MARLIANKFLFIHVAKTGGTFFREAMNYFGIPNHEIGQKHSSYTDILNNYGDVIHKKAAIPIGFVRHPVSWYRSRWAYAKMSNFDKKRHFIPEAASHWMTPVWDDDLNTFVEKTLTYYPQGIATEYFERMMPHEIMFPFIYRYENLQEVTHYILGLLGKSTVTMGDVENMPRCLDSSPVHKDRHIAPSLQEQIEKVEHKIITDHYEI